MIPSVGGYKNLTNYEVHDKDFTNLCHIKFVDLIVIKIINLIKKIIQL